MTNFDINNCTVQEACDYAIKQLVNQGKRCVNGDCVYDDGNGNHCAIGWLLDHDDGDLMGFVGGFMHLMVEHKGKLPTLIRKNAEVFDRLQDVHDDPHRYNLEMLERMGVDTSGNHWEEWMRIATREA